MAGMRYSSELLYLAIVQTLAVMIAGETQVLLEPKDGKVVTGENLTLTCSASGGQWFNMSIWLVSSQTANGFIAYDKTLNECTVTGMNISQYDCRCDGQDHYSTVIMNVGIDRHGEMWQCFLIHLNGTESRRPKVTINVDVPVTNVSINGSTGLTMEVQENTNLSLQCVTSPCRPAANITWYFLDKDSRSRNVDFEERTIVTGNNLSIARKVIWFNASREMNGWSVQCNASNIRNYAEPTDSVKLNVTFTTNDPSIQCSKDGTYTVIRDRLSNVTCSVDGGNPPGKLRWSCDKNYINSQMTQSNMFRTIVLNATETANCTCTSSNGVGKRKTSVTINVLYPPVLKEINYTSIIEGDYLFLKCDVVSANPSVSTITWTSSKHSTKNATLLIQNVSRTDDLVYTCTANNTMKPSCQGVVKGSTLTHLHLDVLYSPLVNIQSPKQFTRNESEMFSYSCPITKGNPSSTMVIWRRSSDDRIWNSRELFIPIVSRFDDSVYTCNASNVMIDSNGTTRYGISNGYIILFVQFQTSVTDFFIQGYAHNTSVVVLEHTYLTFECRVQSKPTADIRILEKNMDVKRSYDANSLFYDTSATCSGEENVAYSCHGENLLSTEPSTRDVFLTVKCKPRADTKAIEQFVVETAINQNVTMSYTVLAYPPPSFVWYRNGSSIDTSDPRTNVFSSKLQTHLTITHVVESDFGEYTLSITNDIGSIIESLSLKPEEHKVHSLPYTSHNVSAIVGGIVGGLVIVCGTVVIVCIYRKRFVKHNRPESSTDQSLPPVTYENLKIEQIPNEPIEHQLDKSDNQQSETNGDNAYEGLSRQDNDKENQYTQLEI